MSFESKNWDIYLETDKAIEYLGKKLKQGSLSLLVGAGASNAFGLPNWSKLVERCCQGEVEFTGQLEADIKNLKNQLKKKGSEYPKNYLLKIRSALYEDVFIDFFDSNKELLIAITTLIITSYGASINRVLSLNFDNILEWYLKLNGLRVTVNYSDKDILNTSDVEIIHPHGYLPSNKISNILSDNVIFSQDEFETFKRRKDDYLSDQMYHFFRTSCFISIGVSPYSLESYISTCIGHLTDERLNSDAFKERLIPFGFAFIQPSESNVELKNDLLNNYGIVVVETEHHNIPKILFKISQVQSGITMPISEFTDKQLVKREELKVLKTNLDSVRERLMHEISTVSDRDLSSINFTDYINENRTLVEKISKIKEDLNKN